MFQYFLIVGFHTSPSVQTSLKNFKFYIYWYTGFKSELSNRVFWGLLFLLTERWTPRQYFQPYKGILLVSPTVSPLMGHSSYLFFFPLSFVISNQNIRYSMSWCAGCLSWWGPLQRGDLCRGFSQLLIDVWFVVSEVSTLNLILLTTQTMVTTGILPPQGRSPLWSGESNPGPRD